MRRAPRPGSLTSMIDVLFILVFASLAYAQARPETETEKTREAETEAPPPVPEPAVDAAAAPTADAGRASIEPAASADAAPADYAALRDRAISQAVDSLQRGGTLVLRVSAAGELTAIEAGPGDRLEVSVPLLERVPDRDVGLAYLGDRSPEMQLCRAAARYRELGDKLVVIAPARPLSELRVALVRGLLRDQSRCRDAGALAVIVEPAAPTDPPRESGSDHE